VHRRQTVDLIVKFLTTQSSDVSTAVTTYKVKVKVKAWHRPRVSWSITSLKQSSHSSMLVTVAQWYSD